MKKRFKHRLAGGKRKPDGIGANPREQGANSTSSLPQPELRVVAGESYSEEGDKVDAVGERVFSTGLPPQPDGPESVPVGGGDNIQEGGEADVDGEEVSQRHSYPHPDVGEVVVGSGRSGELEGVYPSPSTPSISYGGKPDSTWTRLFRSLPLTIPSGNADTALPDYGLDVVRPDEILGPSAPVDEKKSSYRSTASATAELLRGVRDSAGAFGPLRTIARSFCIIIDNYEVCPPPHTSGPQRLRPF